MIVVSEACLLHIIEAKHGMRGDFMKRNNVPALEWLCDLSGKTARITSIGNRKLLVENHCGVRKFTESNVILATRCGFIDVQGSSLTLNEVRRDALVIHGSIANIKLPCAEAEAYEP